MSEQIKIPSAPLFRDPILEGPADPMVIWNREERAWWMLYTARRATFEGERHSWCFGTGIGVASSTDGGRTFLYRGELELPIEPGKNTYWAPEVVYENGVYHMYVTYSRGISSIWHRDYHTAHFTATDMWKWKFEGFINIGNGHDPCCIKMPDGKWRIWWRGNGVMVCAQSEDLSHFEQIGTVDTGRSEGPYVFFWKDYYWMVTDEWHGLRVFRSKDADTWEKKGLLLDENGTRPFENDLGQHATVLVNGDEAYVIYFCNAVRNRDSNGNMRQELTFDERRSAVQVARLEFDGDGLTCDRNKPFHMDWQPPQD